MNIAQRILHVGGRNNAAGYVEFGSTQAVEALVRQVLRDLPSESNRNTPTHDHLSTMIGLVLSARQRGGAYEDGSVIDKAVQAAVDHLKDWPYPEDAAPSPQQSDERRIDDYATEINRLRNVIQAACSGGLDHMIERWKVLFPDAPVPTVKAQPFKVTEEQHVAACKVLLRAHGMAGLPQRMVDAMLSVSEHPSPAPEICGNCDLNAPGCDGLFASDGKACKFHGQGSTTS
ncbi:hypothetical protein DBR47_14550 [Paucibacter sp. KBW04]|nr:hypothetical protein DBR47_14550 [Paucibacter sp. KBW04]